VSRTDAAEGETPMKKILGGVAGLLLVIGRTGAEERTVPVDPPAQAVAHQAMQDAHRTMHDAMMEHATVPAMPATPDHAATHAGAGQANQPHHAAAEQMAQRHAAMHGQRPTAGDPANRTGAAAGHGGMMGGHDGGAGAGDTPAGHRQTVEHHGGPGGMMGGGGAEDGGHRGMMTGGSGSGTSTPAQTPPAPSGGMR
jgi:hypothetical protein